MRTKILPGNGYIRYEVQPGDDEQPPGELVIVHAQRSPPAALETATETARETPVALTAVKREDPCRGSRGKLLVRLFEMRGMQVDDAFAEWLEKNLTVGDRGLQAVQVVGSETMLLTAVKTDGVARGLAEDLARCEQSNAR